MRAVEPLLRARPYPSPKIDLCRGLRGFRNRFEDLERTTLMRRLALEDQQGLLSQR